MESQTLEWKESWDDKLLKTICAFANTDGGVMIIGKDDNGAVLGVKGSDDLLKVIPDSISAKLDTMPSVREMFEDGKMCIKITVEKGRRYLNLDGVYYKRVGSTTRRVIGDELYEWILFNAKMSFTDLSIENINVYELSEDAFDLFVTKGTTSGRMSSKATESDRETLLRNYEMMDGKLLRRSGAILFFERPWLASRATMVKIGAFNENHRLLRDDAIECPVIMQPDRVMDILLNKYVQGTNELDGLMMVLRYPYPVRALREAVMNAVVHRDYSSAVDTDIRVYPDRVEISNPCNLREGWGPENIFETRGSKPTNPSIANAFFAMKYIEKFGSGIGMMRDECRAMNVPEPEYEFERNLIRIVFRLPEKKDKGVTIKPAVDLSELNDREAKIYTLISLGNVSKLSEISEASGMSLITVRRTLAKLIEKEYLQRIGGDRSGKWIPVKTSR
jgi:ATP-dependent DNA helicase RecG